MYRMFYLILLLLSFHLATSDVGKDVPQECFKDKSEQPGNPDVNCAVTNSEGLMILVSTLDGGLFAVDKKSGSIRWKLLDEPVVKSPYDPMKPVLPAFLPDPKDGTLYMMGASVADPLKKLPFTIPELVAASPSKSAEGILYSGKKVDTWFSVDKSTGRKHGALNFQGCMMGVQDTCPATRPGSFLIGRTEYNIMMYDTRTKDRKWNITYYDYSSNIASHESVQDYELVHFSDSSTGMLISLDRATGGVEWETDLESPVVAMYQLEGDKILSVPFTSVSIETLENLLLNMESADRRTKLGETKLFPTLYVGEHKHGLFAVPSLVDKQTIQISPHKQDTHLLEGRVDDKHIDFPSLAAAEELSSDETMKTSIPEDKSSLLVFGYYQIPEVNPRETFPDRQQITHSSQDLLSDPSRLIESSHSTLRNRTGFPDPGLEDLHRGFQQIVRLNATFIFSAELPLFLFNEAGPHFGHILSQIENKELKLILAVVFFTVLWFIRFVKRQFKAWEKLRTSPPSSYSKGSVGGSHQYEVTANPVELSSGEVKVGNIIFNPEKVLGKGCEGTFVYQGKFDNRDVAVKRVLAACFSIADREVDLLRESDEHPNVIRYFCMEQCRQFRYIALELCVATLQDFIEGKYNNETLDLTVVFRQSVQGLAHLHGLDIAHRDIKPQNVLISAPGRRGEVRAMISDFGLCKKLKLGRMSFSQRSGVAGTEGWIAPEMLLGHQSTTCMVDVFSMGCVYYYMLTGGKHPFGDNFHRQANILSGRWNLIDLEENEANYVKLSLIEKMICFEPRDRPPAAAILKHPVFWTKEKALSFLQEVSDRVEKEEEDSVVVINLERGSENVVRGEWALHLDDKVRDDLRRQRTYRNTVKDLLRAMRNKRHHYRELSAELKELYGSIPNEFSDYWISRFPRLLTHTYTMMQCIKYEDGLRNYYDRNYDFVKPACMEAGVVTENISKTSDFSWPGRELQRGNVDVPSKDIFSRSPPVSDRSDNSLVSNWEDLHSEKYTRSNSSSGLLPCTNQPYDSQDSGQSLLGFVAANFHNKEKEKKVRKPVKECDTSPEINEDQVQPKLSFADAVRNPNPTRLTGSESRRTSLEPPVIACQEPPTSPRANGHTSIRTEPTSEDAADRDESKDNENSAVDVVTVSEMITDNCDSNNDLNTTADCDNPANGSDDANEDSCGDETKAEDRKTTPGKRIRKRRKHQKKPRVPRIFGIEIE